MNAADAIASHPAFTDLGYNPQKCAQRNRIAARRDQVDSASLRLYPSGASLMPDYPLFPVDLPDAAQVDRTEGGQDLRAGTVPSSSPSRPRIKRAMGTLPRNPKEALDRINATLPEGSTPMTEEEVYIHYAEAASNRFVGDRYLFLDSSTLRNIAADAARGVSFMNSHRTGGLSAPTELPMGRTFAGRFEEYEPDHPDGRPLQRALIGVFFRRGTQPNGASGPSTDDFHRLIDSGTLADVSVGLSGGDRICDICARELGDKDCGHAPGTTKNLTPEQIKAQASRGVRKGRSSYTLVDAELGEVSGVYAGAVPGAGFRKALKMAARGELTGTQLLEARSAYGTLLAKGDLLMNTEDFEDIDQYVERKTEGVVNRILSRLGLRANGFGPDDEPDPPAPEPDDEPEPEPAQVASAASMAVPYKLEPTGMVAFTTTSGTTSMPIGMSDPRVEELQAQLEQVKAENRRRMEEAAEVFVDRGIEASKFYPSEREALIDLYKTVEPLGKLSVMQSLLDARPSHDDLLSERVPAMARRLTQPFSPASAADAEIDQIKRATAEYAAQVNRAERSNGNGHRA